MLSVILSAVTALAMAPALASATTTGPLVKSSVVNGCGMALKVFTPTSDSATARDFAAAGMGIPGSDHLLRTALKSHVRWLPTVSCRARPDRTRQMPSRTSIAPNTVGPTSTNWSGYTAQVNDVSLAEAQWTVPSVAAGGPGSTTATSSIWPGIGDGISGSDELIQAGTEQDEVCTDVANECSYSPNYYFWLEMFPAESQQEVTNLAVGPGDQVGVDAGYDPELSTSANFLICNFTKEMCVAGGQESPAAPHPDVEWITERTAEFGNLVPLAHYQGAVTFTDDVSSTGFSPTQIGLTTPLNAQQDGAHSIQMLDCSGPPLSNPSTTLPTTGTFTTTWQRFGTSSTPNCG
jgi:hypothetical protein